MPLSNWVKRWQHVANHNRRNKQLWISSA